MSSAIAGTLRIKSPYEFGAHHAGPVAIELMDRYPELTIRIDVEHEIVNPVAENYDIVFAMLEQPAALDGNRDPQGFLARTRPVRGAGAVGKIRRAPHAGRARPPSDADRPQRRALGADHAGRRHRASHGSESAAGQFECRHPVAGGARRARRVAGDGELYQTRRWKPDCCGGSSPIMSASRSTFTRCCRPASSFPQKCDASSMRWTPMAGAAERSLDLARSILDLRGNRSARANLR